MPTATLRGVVLMLAGLSLISCDGRKSSPTAPTPTPVCNPSIAPESQAFTAPGGTASVTVSVDTGCAWTATSAGGWAVIASGASGVGPGTVGYAVQENTGSDPRSTDLTIAGRRHAITQAGRPPVTCEYIVDPGERHFSKDEGEGVFDVIAETGCPWTITSSEPWLAVGGALERTGSGQVRYRVERNRSPEARVASIKVAGQVHVVRQTGDAGTCQYEVTPVELRPCMPETTLTATIDTPAGCPWTLRPTVPWLLLLGSSTGTGPMSLRFSVTGNYDAPRQGVLEVRWPTATAGQNIQVLQAGCRYAVSVSQFALPAAGGVSFFQVLQQSDPVTCGGATQDRCIWFAMPDVEWIVVARPGSHAGDDRVDFIVSPNPEPAARTGRIVVRDRVVVVTQAGR
jgi:BACON domain-containing protein/all-beta uncharacterized protein